MPPASNGFLLIDKPAGASSQDAVTVVRRALGASRAGHTGTLDPFATGLLIVLVGNATRLARFVPSEPKTYEAEIVFGHETDTDDATGTAGRAAPPPDEQRVLDALPSLTGDIMQVPPSYSAKHVQGRRAYAMARRGEAVELAPVAVTVYSWDVLQNEHERWRVRIRCGSGTYLRALARDLGRRAGSAAHLGALRRTAIGPFTVDVAIALHEVRRDVVPTPADRALIGMPRVALSADEVAATRAGRKVAARMDGETTALLDERGDLIAVAERDGAWWQPRVVLADA
jgi:tRNA pseudouridine55 synthase